jgi:hypothetical protein
LKERFPEESTPAKLIKEYLYRLSTGEDNRSEQAYLEDLSVYYNKILDNKTLTEGEKINFARAEKFMWDKYYPGQHHPEYNPLSKGKGRNLKREINFDNIAIKDELKQKLKDKGYESYSQFDPKFNTERKTKKAPKKFRQYLQNLVSE